MEIGATKTIRSDPAEFPSEINAEGELKISEERCPPGAQQIPKIFHQIWIDFGMGSEPNDELKRNAALLKAAHPDWQYILWNDEQILTLIKEHTRFFLDTYQAYNQNIKRSLHVLSFQKCFVIHCFRNEFTKPQIHESDRAANIFWYHRTGPDIFISSQKPQKQKCVLSHPCAHSLPL